jgi:hypothetical protein
MEDEHTQEVVEQATPQGDENVNYGRLLESVHLTGYSAVRACQALEVLLEEDRWKNVGPGFKDINKFLDSIDLSQFKLQVDQRKKLAKKLEAIEASQRATARALGVNQSTIQRSLNDAKASCAPVPKKTDLQVVAPQEDSEQLMIKDGESDANASKPPLPTPNTLTMSGAHVAEVMEKQVAKNLRKEQARQKRQERQDAELESVLEKADRGYAVELGQTWKCGRHRVICGDAYALITELTADALITDPPYGIDYPADWAKWDGRPSDFSRITGDTERFNPQPFLAFPTVLFFGANYFSDRLPLGGWLCWDKRGKEELDAMFGSPFELAWYKSCHTNKRAIMVRVQHGGVVNADSKTGNNQKRLVATQKPIALMVSVLDAMVKEDEVILDPFAGSGTTLLACEKTGRSCIALDIEPENISIILHRYEQTTGDQPCLE